VPVVGRAYLLSVGRADGTVHVENEPIHRRPSTSADHPFLVEIGQGGEVLLGRENLGLEPAHLAGRGRGMVLGVAADDVTSHRIHPKAPGVARDTRPMELELQPTVEMEPQRSLFGFTHWIPSSEGVSGGLTA
jgi:hypothetical protein